MFKLSQADEHRAKNLLDDSIVIDSLGGWEVFSDELKKRIDEMIAENFTVEEIYEEIMRYGMDNPEELTEAWKNHRKVSGVNAISVTMGPFGEEMFSFENAINDLAAFTYKFDVVDELVKVTKSDDILFAKENDKLGVILNFQNTTHIGTKLDNIDLFYKFGIRVIQMTYNDLNLVGAGCTERVDCGLSNFGLKVVERLNKRGILIDISHTGYQTSMDVIEASEVPVAFTHTVCKAVRDHDRGKTDDQLEAIARKNGYVGIVVVPGFITDDPNANLNHFMDHVDHAVKIAGVDKVGIGTDFGEPYKPLADKMTRETLEKLGFRDEHNADFALVPEGYRGFQDFINLSRALVSRGYSDEEVKGILGGNFFRIFKEVVG